MNITNKDIRHILFGEGKVTGQEEGVISVQFPGEYGEKKFLYPDAFEKYLKLYDSDLEASVLEELHDKQMRIEAENSGKQQELEAAAKSRALENLKTLVRKKRLPQKSRTAK